MVFLAFGHLLILCFLRVLICRLETFCTVGTLGEKTHLLVPP